MAPLDDEIKPGVLYPVYWAKCAICQEEDTTNEYFPEDAAKALREDGWIKTRKKGWVCKECYPEYRRSLNE